jgi:hypothetical protein
MGNKMENKSRNSKETENMDYTHTILHQKAYDFGLYLHQKMMKMPHYEKFVLQQDIRLTVDEMIDEIEMYEITKVKSHIYAADRLKRRLTRKIRIVYDLRYSACMNDKAYAYCARQLGEIGKLIGGMIKDLEAKK